MENTLRVGGREEGREDREREKEREKEDEEEGEIRNENEGEERGKRWKVKEGKVRKKGETGTKRKEKGESGMEK